MPIGTVLEAVSIRKYDDIVYSLRMVNVRYKGNSVFGASGDKFNELYDERNKKLTCIFGQLFILDLLDKLEDKFGDEIECDSVNTDGILFYFKNEQQVVEFENVIKEWEKRSTYTMEKDEVTYLVQKDVNNYVMKMNVGDKIKIKSKGAMVKKNNLLDNDLSIVNTAVREYLANGTPVEKTINECDDLIEFQKVYKVTSNYKCAVHNGIELKSKVNRIFASKDTNDTPIFKLKCGKENPDKFAGSPTNCFINNGEIINSKVPENLDKKYYIELAINRVEMFTKVKYKGDIDE